MTHIPRPCFFLVQILRGERVSAGGSAPLPLTTRDTPWT